MNQLIININNQYSVDDRQYFKFQYLNCIHRDIPRNISKASKHILQIICKYCELDYKNLKKKQLIDLINDSNCLIFE